MTTYQKIKNIALPAMVENFLQMLLGLNDTYLVSYLGLLAVSAVSIANNILAIYQAIFLALAAASSAVVSKSLASGQQDQVDQKINQALKLSFLMGLLLGLLPVLFGRQLLVLLGATSDLASLGGTYLAWVGGSIVSLSLMISLSALARSLGQPRLPMYVSLLTNILDLAFSFLAIFVFKLDLLGVALGTILARFVGLVILWRRLSLPVLKLSWDVDKDLLGLALPAAGERLMMRAGDLVLVAIVITFGSEVLAGQAIGEVISQFNYMPGFAVATATLILSAEAQQDRQLLEAVRKVSYRFSFWTMLIISGLLLLLSTVLISLYTQNQEAQFSALLILVTSFVGTPVTIGTLIYTALWQGMGNAKRPFYATAFGMWFIRIGLSYLFGVVWQMGLLGVCLATILDNLFRTFFLYYSYKIQLRRFF